MVTNKNQEINAQLTLVMTLNEHVQHHGSVLNECVEVKSPTFCTTTKVIKKYVYKIMAANRRENISEELNIIKLIIINPQPILELGLNCIILIKPL
jgi:hypothetical protein